MVMGHPLQSLPIWIDWLKEGRLFERAIVKIGFAVLQGEPNDGARPDQIGGD